MATIASTAAPRGGRPEVDARRRARRRTAVLAPLLVLALAASIVVATTIGSADLAVGDVLRSILSHLGVPRELIGANPLDRLRDGIVWQLRVPRVLTAAAVGAGLAIAGAVMQALTRNQLADPYLLGLSSGASLGAVSVILLGVAVVLPVAAFGGALLALAATLGLAGALGAITPTRTVLAGVAVSSLAGAATSFAIFWSAEQDSYREILGWLLGSLAGARWPAVGIAGVAVLVIGLPLLLSGRILDAFAFGDTTAASLGIGVQRTRWILLGATALLTGALVAVSGSIGFVGLVLPHAIRLVVGPGHRTLLPLSALVGAVFLIWADTLARSAFAPRELPVGIVTALIGAPVFALLLARRRSEA
ncbi:putative F420-0 ABC transporter permease subunit [Schumannella sp. 10F1B-5-1]|uniref:putative F420-0 ABC transporter permease subunit n=1 Tax=Schumannella sp. 10F1B-5-1 TaxID=2590780 RepID=UPI0011318C58|nr:putative F420-0 ABC transporter permease subunit [Schumannella sp. 10F1B-5-1]TPW72299.1 iron chelate uptake ABC transporter family permease subunit [Schumannella sp. 10F1B-5-1]